ncbi:MAG: DNA polymerase III subunit delta [Oscillospiraceae bacterium]
MIFKDMEEVRRHIKIGIPLPCYFISGSDDYRKQVVLKKIADMTVKGGTGFDSHRFSGNTSADTLADAAFEITFGGGRRCVIAEDIPLNSVGDSEYKKYEQLITEVCELQGSTVLIFIFTAVDTEPKKDAKKRDRFTPLKKHIDKCGGGIIKCDAATTAELCSAMERTAVKYHCQLDRSLCSYMVERCGNDSALLMNEVKKVAEYRGAGIITKADIDLMTSPTPDARVFDLTSKIAFRDQSGAFAVLAELREMGERPSLILSVLSGTYIDMFRAKAARNSGKSRQDMVRDWPRAYARREFVADKAMTAQGKYSAASLLRCLEILLSAEQKMKSSGGDENVILDETVAKLFAVR